MKTIMSPAQQETLEKAQSSRYLGSDKPVGRLDMGYGGPSVNTMEVLKSRAWIEQDRYIRDSFERNQLSDLLIDRVSKASDALSSGDWKLALLLLRHVQDIQNTLDKKAYWITDAGRVALASMKPIAEVAQ